MNKKILNLILVFSLMITAVFIITAQENQTINDDSNIANLENSENPDNSESIIPNPDTYTDLEDKIENVPTLDPVKNALEENVNESEEEKVTETEDDLQDNSIYISSKDIWGKKEIILKRGEINVTKRETERNEFKKEVTLSSEGGDLDEPIRVNATLTKEVPDKKEIKIYWENNENLEITNLDEFGVEYYDDDENGLIDRVSWIVPHLSTQTFNIIIGIDVGEPEEGMEGEMILEVIGPSGEVRNPINFDIKVNYSGEVKCKLEIKDLVGGEMAHESWNSGEGEYEEELPNGEYTWDVMCFNSSNYGIYKVQSGHFSINEQFYSSLEEGKLYFLDLVQNRILNYETIKINSTHPSNFSVQIINSSKKIIYEQKYQNSAEIKLNESILKKDGNYTLNVTFGEPSSIHTILTNFSVASANISLNATSIKEGGSVKITINVNSPFKKITSVILDYGDNDSNIDNHNIETLQFNKVFTKKYNEKGNYNLALILTVGGKYFEIKKNGLTVTEAQNPKENIVDEDGPSITLIFPENKRVIYENHVNFSYKADDDSKIQNCTFKLYENCASISSCNNVKESDFIFPSGSSLDKGIANINNVQKDKKISIDLKNFDEGFYKWVVKCYDNYSNSNEKSAIFQIDLNGSKSNIGEEYMYKERIERLKEIADAFIISDFSLDEKIVLDEIKLLDEIKYYKKRLLTIQEFFKENYKYTSDESKEKKISDYLDELEGIESSLPVNISIKEKYEYVKNSIDEDFGKIVEDYFYASDIYISKSSLRKLEEVNRKMQSEISVSTSVKLVKIAYLDREEEIRFVEKKVVIENGFSGKILEIIPENIVKDKKDITFITENKPVGDENIYELDYDDLEDGRIIYYITDSIRLKDLEKTETVLFEEDLSNVKVRVTGFFVFGDLSSGIALYIVIGFVLLIILFTLVPVVLRKFRMIAWKKEPNVVRVIHLLEEIDKMLKEKEVEKAREKYYKLQEIYRVLPSKTKPHFYKKISEMLVKIDKKDIFGLVKEYQEAKKRWDKENVVRLYEDIKKIYKRLPDKDRKKVYDIINDY